MGGCASSSKVGMTEEEKMLEKCKVANASDFNSRSAEREKEAKVKSKIGTAGPLPEKEVFDINGYDPSNKYSNVAVENVQKNNDVEADGASPEIDK